MTASASADTLAVVAVMNSRRSEAGSGVLAIHGILQYQAQQYAADMAARNYFSHDTPESMTFQQRMSALIDGHNAQIERNNSSQRSN